MSTATRSTTSERTPLRREENRNRQKLRKDRVVAIVLLLIVVGLMAAMMWLASLSTAPPNIDYWPMMP